MLLILGWLAVALGLIGVFLPILPTTPFLILALALFSKSSPRFHQKLLHNRWFGPTLQQWEATKTLARKTKYKASIMILLAFSISIAIFNYDVRIQLILVSVAIVLLVFIWRIKESDGEKKSGQS